MLVSLEINDNKYKAFLEFLKELDFVKVKKSELSNDDTATLLNERIEEYKSKPGSAVDLKGVLDDLKTKYGF